jgi:hypothetical protein
VIAITLGLWTMPMRITAFAAPDQQHNPRREKQKRIM